MPTEVWNRGQATRTNDAKHNHSV